MRIRDLIGSFRTRKMKHLSNSNLVSFDTFYGDSNVKVNDDQFQKSKPPPSQIDDGYVRFKTANKSKSTLRPSIFMILIVFVVMCVFVVLPIMYLINCFRFSFDNQQFYNHYLPAFITNGSHTHHSHTTKNPHHQLPNPPPPDHNQCQLLSDNDKHDCYPQDGANAENCAARGCCWAPKILDRKSLKKTPLDVPYCFYPANFNTYNVINITHTSFGLISFLRRQYRSPYPSDVEVIKMIVKYETDYRLRIKIVDPNNSRFETPYPEVPIVDNASGNTSYIFDLDGSKSGFRVLRKSDNTVIFDSNNFVNFIYANQLIQISSKLPSKYIYGIGEHRSNLLLSTNWKKYTLWNHDEIPGDNINGYGSHPFYLMMENSTNSHGVFLLNSNAIDVILQPSPAITFRTIGGILDLYFFLGPTPNDVISQYTELIGQPFIPPYWGLGFHLCRFGYKTLNDTRSIMQKNIDAGVPIDTQWNDLDYMNISNDFTYDIVNYKGLPEFVKELHARGMHYIPLIDPGISASEAPGTYPPFDIGKEMDIFVKNISGQIFMGKVWNRKSTVWPDFTNPNAVDYWTLMLKNLHKIIEFDGAWIDMNEPSNFLSGDFEGCPETHLERPPYVPGIDGNVLNYKTMCMTAKHYAGPHYNVHNLYGLTEAIVTSFAMAEIRGKRPMVISRSSFAGLGHYTGHWSGDVWSSWDDMKHSIPSLLGFSLYGIPLMGADICGFNGNSTSALCNRWMQLGAFYPFSRNHNTDNGIPQDPVSMGKQVVESSVRALKIRYSLLPYLYTLFYRAHVAGETVARPVFFEFPKDTATYAIDTQFLWGPALMIIPVLEENKETVMAYIPKGTWYNYYSSLGFYSSGQNYTLEAPIDTIPLLIRGGYIFPKQEARNTSTDSRKSKFELLVAPDDGKAAVGGLYWDDGDSLNSYEEEKYTLLNFNMEGNILRSIPSFVSKEVPPNLASVTILGIEEEPKTVVVNGANVKTFNFEINSKSLDIYNLDVSLQTSFVIEWK